ncbi:hypothetical protein GDO86_016366 [Hymenochirus boettgeri]|uniref:Mis18 domain-containing protein n=1 Tax=Hymenochirus boettgeri TaxID=247094 RepID=A0A8T2K4Y8_9PIPI|nr:hypothetical protein GDO86_016366 [Hymenochirus boettgeri]
MDLNRMAGWVYYRGALVAMESENRGSESVLDEDCGKPWSSAGRQDGYAVFFCRNCYTVMGDSLGVCGDEKSLGAILCLRVTEDVNVGESIRFCVNDDLKGCAYHPLTCRSCGIGVGFNFYSTSSAYANLRGLFCLRKEHILCYILKSNSMVPGKELYFDFPDLNNDLAQLKTELVQMHLKMKTLSNHLEQDDDCTL